MWPFWKKITNEEKSGFKSIICIPGYWKDTVEIFGKTDGRFMVVGDIIMDLINKVHYNIELCAKDERMRKSFEVAGKVTGVTNEFLGKIEKHTSVIYVTGSTGNFNDARLFAGVASLIAETGGIGVKVETTGKAFEKDKWAAFASDGQDADMYELFVVDSLLQEDGTTFSCGMHNVGLSDTIISNLQFKDAQRVVRIFNYYQVIDKPVLKVNDGFQTDINSPFYKITEELNQPYKGNEQFGNPFGMWRLTKE